MASVVRIKRSSVSGNPSILAAGELAYSALPDTGSNGGDRLYIGIGTETEGNAANHIVIGGKYFTDTVSAATSTNIPSTLIKRDSSGDFSANNITASLLGNASSSSGWFTGRDLSLTGDGTATLQGVDGTNNISGALTLASVNNTTGTFGSSTAIPIITVNAKGLITNVSTVVTSSSLSVAGNTGLDIISIGIDTLQFTGGTGVDTVVSDNRVTISIGQPVTTDSNVTFNDVTVNGVLYSNDISSTNISVNGNATITGNLTVQGTTTTVNSTTVAVADKNVVLAKDAVTSDAADGAGITVGGSYAALYYSSVTDRWNLNKDLVVGTVYGNLVGNVTSAGIWTNARNLSLTGDATASLLSVNGSANVSAALTLATVNTTVGTFGTSTYVPNITVNEKGLITNVSTSAIPTASATVQGLAQFSTNDFVVTSGVVTLAPIDGGTY